MKIERRPATVLMPSPVARERRRRRRRSRHRDARVGGDGVVVAAHGRGRRPSFALLVRVAAAAREFVVNIPRAAQVEVVDYCGSVSGRDDDKCKELGLTRSPARNVSAPLIAECPVNLECVVRHQLALGAHDLFIAEIVAVHYDEDVVDSRGGCGRQGRRPGLRAGRVLEPGRAVGSYGVGNPARRRKKRLTVRCASTSPRRSTTSTPIPTSGHAYTTIAADILARFHRQKGDDVFFLTGTDEHGNKIAQAAHERGLTPQEHVDQVAPKFRELDEQLNATNDFFIRTTDAEHEAFVQAFVEKCAPPATSRSAPTAACTAPRARASGRKRELVDGKCRDHGIEPRCSKRRTTTSCSRATRSGCTSSSAPTPTG